MKRQIDWLFVAIKALPDLSICLFDFWIFNLTVWTNLKQRSKIQVEKSGSRFKFKISVYDNDDRYDDDDDDADGNNMNLN